MQLPCAQLAARANEKLIVLTRWLPSTVCYARALDGEGDDLIGRSGRCVVSVLLTSDHDERMERVRGRGDDEVTREERALESRSKEALLRQAYDKVHMPRCIRINTSRNDAQATAQLAWQHVRTTMRDDE